MGLSEADDLGVVFVDAPQDLGAASRAGGCPLDVPVNEFQFFGSNSSNSGGRDQVDQCRFKCLCGGFEEYLQTLTEVALNSLGIKSSGNVFGIIVALPWPYEVMKVGHCLSVGGCTCRTYPPLPPTMDTGFRR